VSIFAFDAVLVDQFSIFLPILFAQFQLSLSFLLIIFNFFLATFSIISKCPVLVFPVSEFHLFFSRYLFPIFFDILMGQKWHTNVHAKFHVFPNFKPNFSIIFKCSGQRFMFFFLKLDAFFSIFCKVSCYFWSSFSKFEAIFFQIFLMFMPAFFAFYKFSSTFFWRLIQFSCKCFSSLSKF